MSTCAVKIPHTPMMQRILKTAEPTIVPTPTSPLVINTPAQRRQGRLQRVYVQMWEVLFSKGRLCSDKPDVYLWLRWRVQGLNFLLPWTWLLLHPHWVGNATTCSHTDRKRDTKDEKRNLDQTEWQKYWMIWNKFLKHTSHLPLVRI